MTPAKYIENYCRVTDRRKALYKKIFDKNKIKTESNDKDDFIDLEVSSPPPPIYQGLIN